MLSLSLHGMLTLSKISQRLFRSDCITLYLELVLDVGVPEGHEEPAVPGVAIKSILITNLKTK